MQPQDDTQDKSSFEILRLTPSLLDAKLLQAIPKQGLVIKKSYRVDLEQGRPLEYSICTSGKTVSVIFGTANDNNYTLDGGGDIGEVGKQNLQMIPKLEDIFKYIRKQEFQIALKQEMGLDQNIRILVPFASDWKTMSGSHAHFRTIFLDIGSDFEIKKMYLIDSRGSVGGWASGIPDNIFQARDAEDIDWVDVTICKKVYTEHQWLYNTTTCGYYTMDYILQLARGVESKDLKDNLGLKTLSNYLFEYFGDCIRRIGDSVQSALAAARPNVQPTTGQDVGKKPRVEDSDEWDDTDTSLNQDGASDTRAKEDEWEVVKYPSASEQLPKQQSSADDEWVELDKESPTSSQ